MNSLISDAFCSSLEADGFYLCKSLIAAGQIVLLRNALDDWCQSRDVARARLAAGQRIQFRDCPDAANAARLPSLLARVQTVLGQGALPVRAILFDKTREANWKVAWHQDLTIAVAKKHETEGFSAWTKKDGVSHVQPPPAILERMLAARIHLDPCGPENGPLRILPASHQSGRLSADEIRLRRDSAAETICTAAEGDVLFMRPLVLHASSPAASPAHRRVLHIEYAIDSLPGGLEWHER